MMNPSIDSLVKKYDSKYIIAVAAAKRARQLLDLSKEANDAKDNSSTSKLSKPVSRALMELNDNKIQIRPKGSKK